MLRPANSYRFGKPLLDSNNSIVRRSLDNRKIEQNAVNAVKQAFGDVACVYAYIDENDKTECVDGHLQVYSSSSFTVETIEGQLPVQVKGTTSKRKSDRPKRQVRVSDLWHYLDIAGGCIYFFVYCGSEARSAEVFYRLLLPYDLKKILAEVPEQQGRVSLRFDRLPSDAAELTRLVRRAVKDRAKQRVVAGIAPKTIEEFEDVGLCFDECEFGIELLEGETPASLAPYKNGLYIYGKSPWGESYPLDKLENIVGVAVGSQHVVSSGDVSLNTMVMAGENEKGEHVFFRGFDVDLSTSKFTLNETGTLTERIEDLALMRAMMQTGELFIDGNGFARGCKLNGNDLAPLENRMQSLEIIKRVVDVLHYKPELDVSALTPQDLRNIETIHWGLVEGELLHYENRQSGYGYVTLADHPVKLVFYRVAEDMYRMVDGLSLDDLTVSVFSRGKEGVPVTVAPLFVQTTQDYMELANIDAEVFAATLQQYPVTEASSVYVSAKMLEMLSAYDQGALCADELLKCCEMTAGALDSFVNREVTLINRCQIAARKRDLTSEEKFELMAIQLNSDSVLSKACAAALRGDSDMASELRASLDEGTRATLDSWPVSCFFTRNHL